jgi:branched-chain amino acid transport system ATP-binding protein
MNSNANPVILRARGIVKRFGKFTAVNNINLSVSRHTIHSVIGPNGAGKTTLFHTLTGTLPATAGTIEFNGVNVTAMADHQRVRHGIARSFQVTSLFASLSVRENLRLAVQGVHRMTPADSWLAPLGAREHRTIVDDILQRMGLEQVARTTAGTLSHGQQRRLEVGMALAARPQAIFLDEPTSGMGIDDIETMKSLIHGLRQDHTVVLIEHNMGIVMDISDTITVMQQGQVLVEGPPQAIRNDERVRAAYLGNMITGGAA